MAEDPTGGLQFDRAEYAEPVAAPATCAACGQTLYQAYYQANDKALCEKCKTDLELLQDQGSGIGRFLRATTYGSLAGAVGAGLWYGVRAATGYEIGLIAILVGLMVGAAVKKGSRGRGGRLYQSLAVFLTYAAIVSTYIPFILQGLKQSWEQREPGAAPRSADAKATSQPTSAPSPPSGAASEETAAPASEASSAPASQPAVSPKPEPAAASTVPASTAPASTVPVPAQAEKRPSLALALVGLAALVALVFALALAAPFLGGFENLIGIAIIAFGLWEAWKINRRTPLVITGPYRVGAPRASVG